MSQIFRFPRNVVVDSGGTPYPNAKAYVYLTGTNTLASVWTDKALTVAGANPIVADANGVFPLRWLDESIVYKLTVNTSADVLIYSEDPAFDPDLTQSQIGAILYPRTDAEIAAGVTPTNYYYSAAMPDEVETPERFGAVGDGSTNDLAAVQAAINTGKSVYFAKTYFLGSYNTANQEVNVLTITGKSNARYFGPGVLKVSTTATYCVPKIIEVDNSSDLDIDLAFTDTGYDPVNYWTGAMAVNLLGTTGAVHDLRVKIRGNNLVCGLNTGNQNATTPTYAIYNVNFDVQLHDCFYGVQCRNGGNSFSGTIKGKSMHRSYFVYGVRDHFTWINSDTHALGSPQDCLIKVYDGGNTENINVWYSCTNFVASTAPVYIGNETTTSKITRDINVYMNDIDSTNTNPWSVFIQSTTAGVADTTTTKVITNIKVSGHCRFVPYVATSFQNTTYRNQLVIELEGDVARKVTSVRPMVYGWSGTPMPGITYAQYLPRWKIGEKIHTIYTGLINSAEVHVPLTASQNVIVPIEMFVDDAPFNSSAYIHQQTTYFSSVDSSGTVTMFASGNDYSTTNGITTQTVTQGVQGGDSENVGALKFTFSNWQTAPNGNSGYLRFVHPDLSRSETAD